MCDRPVKVICNHLLNELGALELSHYSNVGTGRLIRWSGLSMLVNESGSKS